MTPKRRTLVACAGLTVCGVFPSGALLAQPKMEAPPLANAISTEYPQLKVRGRGLLTWFGFRVYFATLWTTQGGASLSEPYVLDLQYLRALDGEALATRSIDEMKGQGVGTEAQYGPWLLEMRRAFPNVKANDRITGLHLPGKGARFFHNGTLTHEVNDATFAKAFFDIWLSPKTSQPGLRKQILGE
jgi:hypothetical protein